MSSEHEVSDATSSYKYGPEECARPIPRLIPSPLSLSLPLSSAPLSLSLSLSLSLFLFDGNIAKVRPFEGFCMHIRTIGGDSS